MTCHIIYAHNIYSRFFGCPKQQVQDTSHREVRKIQLTGKSTYVLSLPKKWIKEMRIGAGDQVTLLHEPDSNSLSMIAGAGRAVTSSSTTTSADLSSAAVVISRSEGSETLRRKVVSTYLAGHNTIHLKVKSGRIEPALREAIRDLVRKNLIGTEIIADSSVAITLQVLLSLPELSVDTALTRMYLLVSAMHRDAILAVTELNHELARGVIKSDDEVDRFGLYISRNLVLALSDSNVLHDIGLQVPPDCLSYRIAVKSIERIGDHAVRIAENCLEINKMPPELMTKISKMSELALSVLRDSVESLLQRNYELADRTVDRSRTIYRLEEDAIVRLEKEKDLPRTGAIRLMLEDIRRTAEYASDIAETAINETINKIIENRSSLRDTVETKSDHAGN